MKTDSPLQEDVIAESKSQPVHAAHQDSATDITTHRARITGPVAYLTGSGRKQHIPIGPCLVESLGGRSMDIIWGTLGQSSVALSVEQIEAARDHGHLVLLD